MFATDPSIQQALDRIADQLYTNNQLLTQLLASVPQPESPSQRVARSRTEIYTGE